MQVPSPAPNSQPNRSNIAACSLAAAIVSAYYTIKTGDICEQAARAYDSSVAGAKRAADLNKAAHVEYESAYLAASAQNIFESAGCLLVASAFMFLVPASLRLMQKARRVLVGKMKLIGSSKASSDAAISSANGHERAHDVSDFSTPEDMARHMVARAVKKTVVQVNASHLATRIFVMTFACSEGS